MATYAELFELQKNRELRNKVTVAVIVAAEEIRAEAISQARENGKNEEIAQKIADGKVRKYLEENTLLAQKYVVDDSKTVKEILPEGATITKFIRYTLGA